jgi:hypothetical protein
MDEKAFEQEWAKIEAESPVPLDPSKVGEVMLIATAAHPLKDQILERTGAGERFSIRLMEPDREAVERGEDVPIYVQLYLDEGPEFISVVTTSVMSFAAEPSAPETEVQVAYNPDMIEIGPGGVVDQGKADALVRLIVDNATPEDRAFVAAHPGLYLQPRGDGMVDVIAADGRAIGAFDIETLLP